jgi:hypothetical protein
MSKTFILGKQGFDCVVKGFRIFRCARRPHWESGDFISWDYAHKEIQYYKFRLDTEQSWEPDSLGSDIMANDWEVYTI